MRFDWANVTIADNFQVFALAGTEIQLEQAIALAFNGRRAGFYAENRKCGLILLETLTTAQEKSHLGEPVIWNWGPVEDMERYTIRELPYTMSAGPAIGYVLDWFEDMSPDKFQWFAGLKRGSHENEAGFLISTGDVWNHIGPHHGAICSVRPHWLWLGK